MSVLNFSFFAKDRNITKLTLFYFGVPLGLIFLGRIIFFFFYIQEYQTEYTFVEIVWALLYGLRFDCSVVFLVFGLFYWLVLISPSRWQFPILKLLVVCSSFINLIIVLLQLIDISYFKDIGRHLSFEVFFLFIIPYSDFLSVAAIGWQNYKLTILVGILSLLGGSYIWFYIYKKLCHRKKPISYKPFSWLFLTKEIAIRGIIFFVIVLLARGGWQLKPLNVSHSFIQGHQNLGNLALSSPFTFLKYLSTRTVLAKPKDWIPREIAIQKTQKLLTFQQEIFLDQDFPFYRRFNFDETEKLKSPPNVVVLVMESWGGKFIAALDGDNQEATPNFNYLSQEGLLFKNFYSSGRRSIQSMSSIFFSLPSNENIPIYDSPFVSNKMYSLAEPLKKKNYETVFFHGGKEGSFNLHNFARTAGYQKTFSLKNFPNAQYDGTWGLWDHEALALFSGELDKLKPPFYGLFFSLSSSL